MRGRLVIVSNRLPVEIDADGQQVRSPGGLASALSSVMDDQVTWVGWAGPDADHPRAVVIDGTRLQPVNLSEGELARYYQGFSNSVLWPLFHGRVRREEMNRSWWRTYRAINERFAGVIARVAAPSATVWVHDYHLLLVPTLLRARRPDLRIGLFLHIPFPNAQLFSMLPWRREVLLGMLGADLIGFQVAEDASNFTTTVERLLEDRIDGGHVVHGPHTVEVDSFPISIDFAQWTKLGDDAADGALEHRLELDVESIFLGVDRLDYTKGITQRLQAFEELLRDGALEPTRCSFVQVAVPSRSDVVAYQDERAEVLAMVERINSANARPDGTGPVHLIEASLDEPALAAWYRAADAMVVTSLADGMNLVAKEFVAARSDLGGVVVLSEFAGAAHDLSGALIVNPYDVEAIKQAMLTAVQLSPAERASRMVAMRDEVSRNDVHAWAHQFLERLDATRRDDMPRGVLRSAIRRARYRVAAWRT